MTPLLELRTRAVYDPAYREYFTRGDRLLTESIAKAVRSVTDGDPECDPDAVAETIQTAALGTMLRRSSTNDDTWLAVVRRELERYTDARMNERADTDD
ncbi:regulatory protein TetR [Natrinema pellirubrum DSM 15624]|uniref:Regulatory protein TetR n=1 Tax=Natrinema pellirubrum (strain DSM 15624 / CIP 106293 / JCM 10476 / NCIMB 786 / 157) TaxID=797303 RepID=L9Z7B5_NATP1|nr:regulatory protein TetR [Natrinema pellirubrum DSM 15624]